MSDPTVADWPVIADSGRQRKARQRARVGCERGSGGRPSWGRRRRASLLCRSSRPRLHPLEDLPRLRKFMITD